MNALMTNLEHPVQIPSGHYFLNGLLYIPENAQGIVLFVHGSGSSRFSVRNQFVAQSLNQACLATLLFDLLTPDEENIDNYTREYRFNIPLLASRLVEATHWCLNELQSFRLPIGYFGASTGGGAALVAAAQVPDKIKAIVSRGGRPDLARTYLSSVSAPTLLIVGEYDEVVIELNRQSLAKLNCNKLLKIVPGATHLFEEPGALKEVARLAKNWFRQYLTIPNKDKKY
ncbi:TPA: alpha/beta hydrolase [Legionella pneumophila]|nr:alpha/beta hydrolase [Legionella pneumophila]HAU1603635.1 alpha/beta hydrolase [Legionella pneumophila]HAU1846858.1 alpha/beta hydrolase [Legionella pneumophila]